MKLLQRGLVLLLALTSLLFSTNTKESKFLRNPAISNSHIAFVYADDLWIADLDGSNPVRLTSDEGVESNPKFSPDGKMIAFTAQYDGNADVYVIPVEGGIPERLTYHPGFDLVQEFTPDGKAIMFTSFRDDFSGRFTQLYTIPLTGGFPTKLPIPNASRADYSDNGKQLAYNPLRDSFRQWKNYRGGTASRIWIYNFSDQEVEILNQPEGRCNDVYPILKDDVLYFLSDRNGEFNLFSFNQKSKEIKQLTFYKDFPIVSASNFDNKIIFEREGTLHIFDINSSNVQNLKITARTDLAGVRERYVSGNRYIRNVSISPSGERAVLEYRGEIVTVPAEKGDPRNITNSTDAHDRSPSWSPDGQQIAYFSDATGEYKLYIAPQNGKGKLKSFDLNGSGFYANTNWSPDGKFISYTDNARNLYYIDVNSGDIRKVGSETIYFPGAFGRINGNWSPDSKWITYSKNNKAYFHRAYVYSLEEEKSYPVSDGFSDVTSPVFDKSGKYLYFFASTNAGPVNHWFAQSTADMEASQSIYVVTLRNDVKNPLFKESDEVKVKEEKSDKNKKNGDNEKKDTSVKIDFENIEYRIVALPVEEGNFYDLQTGNEGEIYYLSRTYGPGRNISTLNKFNLKKKKSEPFISGAYAYVLSADKKKLLYGANGSWSIAGTAAKPKPGTDKLNTNSIQVKINPKDEWKQIFNEAWRMQRDYFYAENFHGADWDQMHKKYSEFLPYLTCRTDLNTLMQWLCSELAVGHHRNGGGYFPETPDRIPGGLLGADYQIKNNRYQFKKVYGGLNWNPDLRSPLKEPGINVKEGEYLLAVNGEEVNASENIFKFFENTSGKITEITVGPNHNGEGARTFNVVPVGNEYNLRNRDWVEGNMKRVHEATNGKVAYVYVPNTAGRGHTYFKRYFFPQSDKDAIIVDERFNGGGLISDYYIDILRRPFLCKWNYRHGIDTKTPSAAIGGPKVLLIDETAGSGGDMFPWMFDQLNIGTIIGRRTWGGLVGILGFPTLMDGGFITAPNVAIYSKDGWVVENAGVPPHIEVEQLPKEVMSGKDPQLEKAIEVILKQLEENPPKDIERPKSYPFRAMKK